MSCQQCGACCTTFRVTLPRCDIDNTPGGWVPAALTEFYTPTTACMRANHHNSIHPNRCIALIGEIGVAVHCSIYAQRPSACRDFAPLSALDQGDEACDEARRHCGLALLNRL